MKEIWWIVIEESEFPKEAVKWVQDNYYTSSKARKIMEYYMFDNRNMHQTTISRNEEAHAAYHNKTQIISKLAEIYQLRWKHKIQWI